MMKTNDNIKYSVGNYNKYIDTVQDDFTNLIQGYEAKLRHWACAKVLLTVSIPIALVLEFHSTAIAICLTSAATFCEFYTKLLKYEDKIKNLNYASCKLTCEFSLYSECAGEYKDKQKDDAKRLYVENTSKLIMEADIASYKMLDLKAIDDAVSKVST